jgi:hypothetical protein
LYFFWDFGYVGVAVGMVVFGVGARWIWEVLSLRPHDLFTQLLASLSLWFIVVGLRNDPVDTFIGAVFTIAPLFGIFASAPHIGRLAGVRTRPESSKAL